MILIMTFTFIFIFEPVITIAMRISVSETDALVSTSVLLYLVHWSESEGKGYQKSEGKQYSRQQRRERHVTRNLCGNLNQ
jgi:hypothetical protein